MDAWFIVAAVAIVALTLVTIVARRQRGALDGIRRALEIGSERDPVAVIASLHDQVARAEATTEAMVDDRSAFVDAMAQGVLFVDDQLRIVWANAAAHELLGRTGASLAGHSVIEAFLDTGVEDLARLALSTGSATGEIAVAGVDGPRLLLRARKAPSGGLWLILDDVSELRRLQQIRTEFIDNLSHELRTPLTTVSLLAETLSREAEAAGDAVPARMRDRISKIEVETGHLVQMVNELLDLSRIESGGALGAVDLLDLGDLAVESSERLRLFAERQAVDLGVEVEETIPPVRGDADRLGQVLVNLLHNAVKFSPDGGDVRVTVRTDDAAVIVAVADHGVGIPRAAQGRIFERFYKVDRARVRGETGGTGLGLAISRHIVEQHGGRIWVEFDGGRREHLLVLDPGRCCGRAATHRGIVMDRLHVATLNIRNLADRWFERLPLLLADMAALQPDLLGLQEVVYVMQQDRLIGAAGEGHYGIVRGWAGRPEYGNSLLVREPLVAVGADRLDLGLQRSAQSSVVTMPGGARVQVVVTHLHHLVPDASARDDQAAAILGWLDDRPDRDATIVMGDFNAHPSEPAPDRLRAAGFRSAFAVANGSEPAVTWPSGLQAPAMDTDGDPACLDYIWVRGAVTVESARLIFDRPDPTDPTLYASDHLGIATMLQIG